MIEYFVTHHVNEVMKIVHKHMWIDILTTAAKISLIIKSVITLCHHQIKMMHHTELLLSNPPPRTGPHTHEARRFKENISMSEKMVEKNQIWRMDGNVNILKVG